MKKNEQKWKITIEVTVASYSSIIRFEESRLYSTPTYRVHQKERKLISG